MADVSTPEAPKEFTVATWNANCLNPNPQAAADYLFSMEPRWDILCLQEVSVDLESALLKKGCLMRSGEETFRQMPDLSFRATYSVILVRKPLRIIHYGIAPFPTFPAPNLRERILRRILTLMKRNEGRADGSNFIYVDVAYGQKIFRVFSLYFTWSSLNHREQAWERVCDRLLKEDGANIVCGDFNIFDTIRGSILNWFLGTKLSEIMPPDRNRKYMQEKFWRWGLWNPLDGITTNKSLAGNMQLDHVLLPRHHTEVIAKGVKKFDTTGRFKGSDHLLTWASFKFVE